MAISNYAAGLILGEFFRGINASVNVPATMYLGLSTTTINASGTGVTEPDTAEGYARMAIATTTGNWDVVSAGITANSNAITFPTATGDGWSTITYVFLSTTATRATGEVLYYEAITPRDVPVDTTVLFPAGSIQILMNNT